MKNLKKIITEEIFKLLKEGEIFGNENIQDLNDKISYIRNNDFLQKLEKRPITQIYRELRIIETDPDYEFLKDYMLSYLTDLRKQQFLMLEKLEEMGWHVYSGTKIAVVTNELEGKKIEILIKFYDDKPSTMSYSVNKELSKTLKFINPLNALKFLSKKQF